MIERGLIAWLVTDYLAKADVKIYGLEYSTALLMNLCLHRSGKEQCVPIATTVLEILVNLLIRDIKPVSNENCMTMCFNSEHPIDQPVCQWSPL
jgi:hypothetical protein